MNTSAKLDEIMYFIKVESVSKRVVCRHELVNIKFLPKLAQKK